MLRPGDSAPALQADTVSHGPFDPAVEVPAGGTYLFFHRGRHCKWTRLALKELDDRIGDFALRGIRVAALSGDGGDVTAALREQMQLIRLPLCHSLDVREIAGRWGGYLTEGATEEGAPALHLEPMQVWIRPDGAIGTIAVQSGPNLWPDVTNTLRGIENTMTKFPERGGAVP